MISNSTIPNDMRSVPIGTSKEKKKPKNILTLFVAPLAIIRRMIRISESESGQRYRNQLRAFIAVAMIALSMTGITPGQAQQQVPWAQSSLGSITGSLNVDTIFMLGGSGSLSGTSDSFSFARMFTATPVDLKAEVTAPGAGFAGVMVRYSTGPTDAHISVGLTSGNVVQLTYRSTNGGSTTTTTGATTGGATLVRILEVATTGSDATFQASYSTDGGSNYTNIGSTITIAGVNWYEGLTVVSGTGSLAQSTFRKFSFTQAQMDTNGFQMEDIGSPTINGQIFFDYKYAGGGAGNGVVSGSAADSVNFAYFPASGDVEMTTRVVSMTSTHANAIAGLEIRDALTANGAQLTVALTHSAGVALRYRTAAGGNNSETLLGSISAPTYLRLRRSGNSVSVYNSSTGATGSWTQVGTTQTIALPTNAYVGFATASGSASINQVVYDNVNLWAGQTREDIGSTGATGTVSYDAATATLTVEGAGTGIGSTQANDQYAFVGVPVTGLRAQVTTYINSQENTDANAFAGPMIRYAVGWPDPHIYALGTTPSNGAKFISRPSGGTSSTTTSAGVTAPRWLRLVNGGGIVYGYISSDASTWTQISKLSTPLSTATYKMGMAVSSGVNGTLSTAAFERVVATCSLSPTSIDIGTTGDFEYAAGEYTLTGAGSFGGTADSSTVALGGAYGDIELVAKVTSQTSTNAYSAAGLTIRESKAADARFGAVTVSPSNGVVFTCRTTAGQPATTTLGPTVSAPVWLKLVRSLHCVAGYYSTDQSHWRLVGKCYLITLPTNYFAGFTVNSMDDDSTTTATFEKVYQFTHVPQRGTGVPGTPSNFGMVMWLRADADVTDAAGPVSSILDQSDYGNNASETTSGNQPAIVSPSTNNNLPAISFTGSPRRLSLGPNFRETTNGMSMFIVSTPRAYASNRRLLEIGVNLGGANPNQNNFWVNQGTTTSNISFHSKIVADDSPVLTTTGAPMPANANHLLEVTHNGGTSGAVSAQIYVDGVEKATTSTMNTITDQIQHTANFIATDYTGGANYYTGEISEIIMLNERNDAKRVMIEKYAANKYNIGSPSALVAPTLTPRYKIATTSPQTVTMTAAADAQIFYTLDGTDPWIAADQRLSPGALLYNGALSISENTTIKAVALQPHYPTSVIVDGRIEFDANAVPPAQPGLVAWFRADKGVTTSGSAVTNWGDISGNDYKANPGASGTEPTTTTVSSQAAFNFDGTNDYLQITPDLTNWSGATIFIVTNPDTLATSDRFYDFGTAASTNNIRMYQSNATGGGAVQIYDSTSASTVSAASGVVTAGSTQILEMTHNDGPSTTATVTIYTNGTQKAQSTTMKALVDIARDSFIGKAFGASNYLDGKVSELIIYNQLLNSTQRTAVINYLKSRYSIP